jgi:hypothetical protein
MRKLDRIRRPPNPEIREPGGGQQLRNAVGNDAEEPFRPVEHNTPADHGGRNGADAHEASTPALAQPRARQPIVEVVIPVDPPTVNRGAAAALLRLLLRAYQDRNGGSSIASS